MCYSDLNGKVALITGGSKGIGKATSLLFSKQGASVVIVARNADLVTQTAKEITDNSGQKCLGFNGSVTNFTEMRDVFQRTISLFGRLDILVNCAGTNNPKSIMETTLEEWSDVLNVNLTGVFICCKLAAETMVTQRSGNIINVSSVQSRVGGRSVQYSASKAGVEGLTRSLARQLGPYSIRVNAVAPGGTDTDHARQFWSDETRERIIKQTLLGRIANPEEIAKAILFMASDESSYITGSTFHINGGSFVN